MDSLAIRLLWIASCVVSFAVAMTGLLLYFKYQNVVSGLQRDRALVVVGGVAQLPARDLTLGQDFSSFATLPDVVARRHSGEAFFRRIDVTSPQGKIAYSTSKPHIGAHLPAEWAAKLRPGIAASYFAPERHTAVAAYPIHNSLDQLAGFAVVHYARELEHEAMSHFAREMLVICLIATITFALLLFLALLRFHSRLEKVFRASAESFERHQAPPPALALELQQSREKIAEAIAAIEASGDALEQAR
jgi:hypothetical protein